MTQLAKPIPAFYAVYVLRSTVRHASIYIGSTPNPPRRLKQHNGEARGGAARTSRTTLRPWEMVALVTGFPSMVSALKFEWALTNPHVSLHIPSEARLTAPSKARKKNNRPRKAPHSLKSVVANIHLLAGVPSFARWPLDVHFLAAEARKAWDDRTKAAGASRATTLRLLDDFVSPKRGGEEQEEEAEEQPGAPLRGIHALPLDYAPMKPYVEKAHGVVSFEREGACVHCGEALETGRGLHAMCPNDGCEAMGHLDCWGRHALGDDAANVIPDACWCPSCDGEVRWGDMVKELSLRVRGANEVDKLLRVKKRRTKKAAASP